MTEDAIRSSNPAIAHLASDAPLPSGATVTIPPKGPTIAEVAAKNGVAELAIRQANPDIAHLASDAPLPPNTVVRVPSKLEVEKGPTISEVARKYAVTEKEVRDNNPDIAHYPNDRPLPLGLALRVPVPSPQTIGPTPSRPAPAAPIKLQTISDLSWKYGVSEQLIRDSNPELASYPSDKPLPPNTALRIPAGGPSPTPRPEDLVTGSSAPSSSPPPPPPRHTAETITTAARRLAVSELVIRQLNPDVAGLASDAPIPAHVVLRGPIPSGAPSRVSGDSSSPALVFASTMGGPSHPPPLSAGTIADISWKYGVTEQVIRDHNPSIAHYPSDRPLPPNTSIRIPDGVATAPAMNANRPATPIRASDFATGVTTTTTATFVASRPQPPPTLAGAVIEQQQPSPYATSSASSSYGATADARNTTDVLTIASVSWKYGVSERLVRDYNPELADYPSERPIPSGVSLKIPGAAVAAGTAIPTASPSGVTTIHSGGGEEGGRQLRAEDMSTLRSPPTQLTTTSGGRTTSSSGNVVAGSRTTISDLAWSYGVTETALRDANPAIAHLPSGQVLPPDTTVILPATVKGPTSPTINDCGNYNQQQLKTVSIPPRQPLQPPPRTTQVAPASHHVLVDHVSLTLVHISQRCGVPLPSLLRLNPGIRSATAPLPPGTVVILPAGVVPPSDAVFIAPDDAVAMGRPAFVLPDNSSPDPRGGAVAATSATGVASLQSSAIPLNSGAVNSPSRRVEDDDASGGGAVYEYTTEGNETLRDVAGRCAASEETLRDLNPFLRRYHSLTVIPPGTTIVARSDGTRINLFGPLRSPSPYLGRGGPSPSPRHRGGRGEAATTSPPRDIAIILEHTVTSRFETLRRIQQRYHLSEGSLRRMNPHLTRFDLDEELPVGLTVVYAAPIYSHHEREFDSWRLVTAMGRQAKAATASRFLHKWRLFLSLFASGGEAKVAKELMVDRDRLQFDLETARMRENDLRHRVSELRIENDRLSRQPSPVRHNLSLGGDVGGGAASSSRRALFATAAPLGTSSPTRSMPSPTRAQPYSPPEVHALEAESRAAKRRVLELSQENQMLRYRASRADGSSRSPPPTSPASLLSGRVASGDRLANATRLASQLQSTMVVEDARLQAKRTSPLRQHFSTTPPPAQRYPSPSASSGTPGNTPILGLLLSGLEVVRSHGPAAEAGIQPGDRITKVLGRTVGTASQLRGAIGQYVRSAKSGVTGTRIPISLETSGGEHMTVFVSIGRPTSPSPGLSRHAPAAVGVGFTRHATPPPPQHPPWVTPPGHTSSPTGQR